MSDGFWAGAISRRDGSPGDGIHLLWTAPYAAGYSTTGYDVQRRTHQRREETCYTLTVDELEILHREFRLTTPVADIAVRATPCPTSPGTLPDEAFTPAPTRTMHCIEFAEFVVGQIVDDVDGARLKAFEPTGAPRPHAEVRAGRDQRGVDCGTHLEIELPVECIRVELTLVGFAQPARMVARRADGSVGASASTSQAVGEPETVALAGEGITRVAVVAPADAMLLTRLCWEPEPPARVRAAPSLLVPDKRRFAPPSAPPLAAASVPLCLRYRLRLNGEHQVVRIIAQAPWTLAVAMREGKAVDTRGLADPSGVQRPTFLGRGVDEVLLYTSQRLTGLTVCVDVPQTPGAEAAEWANVPFLVKGLQMPLRSLDPTLGSPADELTRATSRLIGTETIDASVFADVADTLNEALGVGAPSPMWCTTQQREQVEDAFVEIRPWPYALSLTTAAEWRRALGFGLLDKGSGLVQGQHYDYRVTGHFRRRDVEEQLLAFHTVPTGATLPATFHLGTVRLSGPAAHTVELFPPVQSDALSATGRKGIRIIPINPLSIGFDEPVKRVVLELEPKLAGPLQYSAKTSDLLLGLSGTLFANPVPAQPRVTLDFPEPIDTLRLVGTGFLYGLRVLEPTSGNPDDVLDLSVIVPDVTYEPTAPPAPPIALGTTNLQQPIQPGQPEVTVKNPPHSMGFRLRWLPPTPVGGTPPIWPPDLGGAPPFDVMGFRIERRHVDANGPFEEIGRNALPTVFFGNRGARGEAQALGFGTDILKAYPEVITPLPPVDPWLTIDDVLRSPSQPDGPPPGSTHQYRIFSIDAIGRLSATPTTGSIVRLEKRIAPPQPRGPAGPPPGLSRPAGVRARVLQSTDPALAVDDIVLLGPSTNAVVLEWGWTDEERERDPFATEFRVYFQPLPPDAVHGTLQGPAVLVGGLYEMACSLDQPVPADAMKGIYVTAGSYPFKVASNTAGTSITVRFEPSVLQPAETPGAASFEFGRVLDGIELRPSAWQERTAVVPIGAGAPQPFVFRDRLSLDSLHTRARAWVGVSSADGQTYIADELGPGVSNGGRPGNESSIVALVAEARYLDRPTFDIPPPLPNVPEDVSPEPVGTTVTVTRDLPTLLPTVVIPAGHRVTVDRFEMGMLAAALSRNPNGSFGVLFPDGTQTSYTLGNPSDRAALQAQIAAGEPARIENRFLMDLLLRFPTQFEALWQPALPAPVAFGVVTDALPNKAERWLHRIRLVDPAGHVSRGGAIGPRVMRVASTRVPSPPEISLVNSETDALALTARMRQAFDLKWLVLFTLVAPVTTAVDDLVRKPAQLLRVPDRRELYPREGMRLRLSDGTLLQAEQPVDVQAIGTVEVPDVLVPAALAPGFEKRVSVWALTMTRDGIPSRLAGPVTVHTGPLPLVVPGLIVTTAGGNDTALWASASDATEVALERSTDGGLTFRQVSPWLPSSATSHVLPGSGARVYRLAVRGLHGQQPATGPAVTPV